ncbi:DNA mismatch repair endonuclease MutL [Henriciella litoralis]|uniref:DNA mismatch repair endonuclease MutL n=1 Tax=Henriciella litoralis TaxID=568102 RepID=UPI000A0661DE|nr:DNA mismatch repair endonuclease MutL [Henriciella litoralis]
MPDSARLPDRPVIRQLPPDAVNRIAAGEVVERPAAAVKELVENAIDAGAKSISISIEDGGLKRITVEDDGCGMSGDDMLMALERHATSKLAPGLDGMIDLLNIQTMGFRGEALPSIASVSRMTLTSKAAGDDAAAEVFVEAGRVEGPKPAAWTGRSESGTRIEVRDLFHATPARLKFMKSERAETMAVTDAVKRLAMANATISFSLESNGRSTFRYSAHSATPEGDLERLGSIMGREFRDNAIPIESEREGVTLSGFAGLPTLNRGNAQYQFLFVNGRPVKDRMLTGVIRAAYQDFLARDRHPMAALFVDCDPELVDVNVHPAKTEVRFRDPGNVRGLIIGSLRHALAAAGHRASTTVAGYALGRMQGEGQKDQPLPQPSVWDRSSLFRDSHGSAPRPVQQHQPYAPAPMPGVAEGGERYDAPSVRMEEQSAQPIPSDFPLGVARAQLHETYIVAQTRDGIVIVDQHAAHERLVYEQMKRQMEGEGVKRQALLIPEIVELGEDEASRVIDRAEELAEMGLEIEAFGAGAICVRATPALFGNMDAAGLIKDLADDFAEYEEGLALKERFEDVMGNMACSGGAVRAGRRLNSDEMNALLRQMEATPYSGQCNHGRPTYVELKLADVERLFGRR